MIGTQLNISIDESKTCAECGKGGAAESGICMTCATKIVGGKPMRSETGKAIAARWQRMKAERSQRPAVVFALLQKGE